MIRMKYMSKILSLLLVAFATAACEPEAEDYLAAGLVEGEGAYFAPNNVTSYTNEETSGSFTVNVLRTNYEEAATVSINAAYGEGSAEVFTVPASVDFAAGDSASVFTVSYANMQSGGSYSVTLSMGEDTPYTTTASQTFTVRNWVEKWEVVSKEAVLVENLFEAFGSTPLNITNLVVEKEQSTNMYRFRSPFDNDYFMYQWGMEIYADDSNLPYIVLDGETYADAGYYIASTALGFQMVNGEGPKEDATWNTFGSVAGNLSTSSGPIEPGNASYPLGSYDETTQMFDLGSVYHNIGGYGYYTFSPGVFQLWLDPSMMETDYDRDYTWMDVPEAAGYFTSEVAGGASWVQAVEVSDEDSTFYRLPYLYAGGEKNHLYFHLDIEDEYKVTVPSGQHWTGLTSFGQTVWVEGVTNGSSYDVENDKLTLALNLYLANEEGEKMYDLGEFTETFLWGQPSEFVEADITDYVGNWLVPFDNGQGALQIPVTISQEDDATLKVQGLSGVDPAEYDDTMYLDYDAASGQVAFFAQQVASIDNLVTLVTPFNSSEGLLSTAEGFVGGLTRNGSLKFTDAPTNQGTYDSMIYLLVDNGYGMLTGYWNYLEWQPATEAASARSTKFVAPKTFKPTVKKGFKPRRTYKPELNLKAQPVQKKASSMRATMNVSQPAAGNHFSLTR